MGKKILIVDDASFMRLNLRNILESQDYEVAGEATNGNEAIKLYKETEPDLVTMDITMPEKDGITAMKEILEIDSSARVLVISAMGQEAYIKKAIVAGAKHFIVKPFKKDNVVPVIEKVLNGG